MVGLIEIKPMSKVLLAFHVATAVALIGSLQGACGGKSFTPGGESRGEGGSSNESGTPSIAGMHSKAGAAGTSHGGTSGFGGNANGGDGGGGGATGGACSGPYESGPIVCDAAIPRWTHDAASGLCVPIFYGGCGATQNLYETLEACQGACPSRVDACKQASDCVLASPGCCGVCDSPNVSAHDFIAFNQAYTGKASTCDRGVACAACPPTVGGGTLKYFVPDCLRGRCVVEDLRTSAVTACAAATDCKLHNGSGCCPGCNAADLISVRNDGSFEDLVCGDSPPPCLECLPPDSNAVAICGADHHCGVSRAVDIGAAGANP